MSAFVKTRDSALKSIKRYMTKSIDDAFNLDIDSVESYLGLLSEQWDRFNTAQDAVEISCGVENAEVEENARIQAETWYATALSNFKRIQKCRAEPAAQPTYSSATVSASIRLPKMDLPSFAGDSTEWISFYDAFCSLIDCNAALSGGQKLHYLRSCLKGEALSIINGFKISDANYSEAWSLLKSRYKVMRVIVEAHLRAIADIRKATSDTADAIKSVLNEFQQHIRELKALGRPVEFWDDWLVHEIVNKLAFETRKQWELSLVSDEPPTFEQLTDFLEIRCRSLSMLTTPAVHGSLGKPTSSKPATKSTKVFHAVSEQNNTRCMYCSAAHKIYACEKFRNLDFNAKSKFIKESKACLNCLSPGHYKDRCNSASVCRICHQRHHTLIHGIGASTATSTSAHFVAEANRTAPNTPSTNVPPTVSPHTISPSNANTNAASVSSYLSSEENPLPVTQQTVLLSTALVKVRDCSDRWQTARLLFDSGSHATFVTEACVQRLGLPRTSSSVIVTGIGSSRGGRCRGETSLVLSSYFSKDRYPVDALILPKITSDLPSQMLDIPEWPHIHGLFLADPEFMKPSRIDILVGMDVMNSLICPELRKGPLGAPIAQKTVFGWTLCGNISTSSSPTLKVQSLHCDVQLDRALTRLWELEESPQKHHFTHEERFCEDHFASTHQRTPDGRFLVELPLKVDVVLGESRDFAVRSLLRIERRMARDKDLQSRYSEFMQELIDMGHMEPVSETTTNAVYYMPHHPVLKESSVTTKLRVVFNASAKTTSGSSLNDALFVGPQLQHDLYAILLRFRTYRFAVTADVAKMYRQVCVSPKHIDLQRIVWRPQPSSPMQDYRMLRVTYGVAAASHLAVKAMQQTAKDSSNDSEKAISVILNDFYMDDLLTGTSCKTELQSLQQNVSEILLEGGFELRKWASNCKELNESISESSKGISHYVVDGKDVHALGLMWDTEADHFTFAINLKKEPATLTKRSLLADASTLFDPLGLLAPVTIKAKMWFQDVWRSAVGWDELIPDAIEREWRDHRFQLQKLKDLEVNRWIGSGAAGSFTELHVFADASERAYAAVVYARTLHSDGTVTVTLISSKTKVAPLKPTTLPRLELCAAHLASKLVRSVLQSWCEPRYPLYAWTDSTITLAWLQGHPSKWITFVANRVAEIQDVLPPRCWHHVRSELNPADCASRGISPSDLLCHELWWNGPDFLKGTNLLWKEESTNQHETDLGIRNKVVAYVSNSNDYWSVIKKYSSYLKLRRIIAYCLRFISNIRATKRFVEKLHGPLSGLELVEAERCLVKYTQNFYFANELSHCRAKRPIPLRSSLVRLQPFIDPNGVLRVGGRLKSANVTHDVRHPIILPKNSPLSRLIISDIHYFTLHAGPRIMQVVLQRRYWVIAARSLIRSIYHKCVKCICINRNTATQSMGDLPAARTIYARCFTRTAVDFAGPYSYKYTYGRGAKSTKGYICSFICMCTGAMHLEFVGDLSTPAFLNAFKRFVNRRGFCKTMFSDNGTNFVGAEKELRNRYEQCMADETLQTFFADSSIEWRFNPPTAPHMGGYWETGIKRIKYHLKRVLGETLLSYEDFSTLLTEVEACVNSRPLCEVSTSATDLEALTPGHFIIGEPLKAIPEPEGQGFCGNVHQRWQIISQVRRHFWRRWRDEYLLSLQRRTKWFRPSRNFEEGDVVAIFNESSPPSKWTLARVIRCHPGADGRVRVVTVKTSTGEFRRPIAKLCLLPTKEDLFCENED